MDEVSPRPAALRVMAEFGAGDPVWDAPDPVALAGLGVSAPLARRLRAWHDRYLDIATTDFEFPGPDEEELWVRDGLRLAYDLQNELPDIEVSYAHDDDRRPVRERRGP